MYIIFIKVEVVDLRYCRFSSPFWFHPDEAEKVLTYVHVIMYHTYAIVYLPILYMCTSSLS